MLLLSSVFKPVFEETFDYLDPACNLQVRHLLNYYLGFGLQFFEMTRHNAIKALEIYKRATLQV